MSINLHGNITEDNYDQAVADTQKYGPLRVQLSLILAPILDQLNLVWTLDGGTLLGAWRNGQMLPHDDDFDMLVYHHRILDSDTPETKRQLLQSLAAQIKPHLPQPYQIRIVSSYCFKLEVFDPTQGNYPFKNTNYHNVTCDLTLILHTDQTELLQFQHTGQQHLRVHLAHMLPVSTITYEGHTYPAPHSAEGYLRDSYGYLGPNAIFDQKTGLYIPKPTKDNPDRSTSD